MTVRGSGVTRATLAAPPICTLCSAPCNADDYCYGCESHVCENCDHPDADKRPQGVSHEPGAHRVHLS